MFDSVKTRFALRAVLVGVLAGLAVLKTALADGSLSWSEMVEVAYLAIGASAAYAGIGAAVPVVEPSIGVTPDAPPPGE
jgi:hypothetical protein